MSFQWVEISWKGRRRDGLFPKTSKRIKWSQWDGVGNQVEYLNLNSAIKIFYPLDEVEGTWVTLHWVMSVCVSVWLCVCVSVCVLRRHRTTRPLHLEQQCQQQGASFVFVESLKVGLAHIFFKAAAAKQVPFSWGRSYGARARKFKIRRLVS